MNRNNILKCGSYATLAKAFGLKHSTVKNWFLKKNKYVWDEKDVQEFVEYRDLQVGGVYKIQNVETGKVYIGQTDNINKRFHNHKNSLKKNKHPVKELQDDYNAMGDKGFVYSVIKKVKGIEQRRLYEDSLISQYNIDLLYNRNIDKERRQKINKLLSEKRQHYEKIVEFLESL